MTLLCRLGKNTLTVFRPLQKAKVLQNKECSCYKTKLYLMVRVHFWRSEKCWVPLLLPLLPLPPWPRELLHVRIPSIGQLNLLGRHLWGSNRSVRIPSMGVKWICLGSIYWLKWICLKVFRVQKNIEMKMLNK